MRKILLLVLLAFTTTTFGQEIRFSSPKRGETVKKSLTIRLQPRHENVEVHVWIEEEHGREKIVWKDTLNRRNKYTIKVNTSKFKKGRYELNAVYHIGRDIYKGDIDFFIK